MRIFIHPVSQPTSSWLLSFAALFLLVADGSCQSRVPERAMMPQSVGAATQPSEAQLLEVVRQAVVQIAIVVPPKTTIKNELASQFDDEGVLRIGTGVFVNSTDVLTAAHVVNDARAKLTRMQASGDPAFIAVGLSIPSTDGPKIKIRKGSIYVSVDPGSMATENRYDLGLLSTHLALRATPKETPPSGIVRTPTPVRLPVKISRMRPEETASVFACGFVASSPVLRTTVGTIASAWDQGIPSEAAKFGGKEQLDLFQATLGFNPGRSGGPVFRTSDGALIGLIIEASQNNNVTIIPSQYIIKFLTDGQTSWRSADPASPSLK